MPPVELPEPIQRMIDATNRGDRDAFAAQFSDDARITDFGRTFHGREGARRWDESDNIGVGMHFDITSVEQLESGLYNVGMVGTSRRFNGPGFLKIALRDDLITALDTA